LPVPLAYSSSSYLVFCNHIRIRPLLLPSVRQSTMIHAAVARTPPRVLPGALPS
jgi:hypothetical protein